MKGVYQVTAALAALTTFDPGAFDLDGGDGTLVVDALFAKPDQTYLVIILEANNGDENTDYIFNATLIDPLATSAQLTDVGFSFDWLAPAIGDPLAWGLLTPFNRYVAYEQPGLTAIGEYFRAFDKDPRLTTMLRQFPFWLSQDGAQFGVNARPWVWLYFRQRRPDLTGDAWDGTAVYTSGQQVYFAASAGGAGNFYTSNQATAAGESPASAPAKWDVVVLPYFLRGYLIAAGFSDWLTQDGQTEKAAANEALAVGYLEQEVDKLQRQQQQVGRFSMNS